MINYFINSNLNAWYLLIFYVKIIIPLSFHDNLKIIAETIIFLLDIKFTLNY